MQEEAEAVEISHLIVNHCRVDEGRLDESPLLDPSSPLPQLDYVPGRSSSDEVLPGPDRLLDGKVDWTGA